MLIGLRSARAGDKGAAFRWTMIYGSSGIVLLSAHPRMAGTHRSRHDAA